jgi:dipeptidyl aminopeptidase/acylaminoacyl peptidase
MTQTRTSPPRAAAAAAALLAALWAVPSSGQQQEPAAPRYLTPPQPIAQILDSPPTPSVLVGRGGRTIALLGRENLPPIAELAEPELRLAGVRVNPRTHGPSRSNFNNGITFQDVESGAKRPVSLPQGARIAFPRWSPDGSHLAFANVTPAGIELWVAEAATGQARRLTGPVVSAVFGGSAFDWAPDGRSLLFTRVAGGNAEPPAPTAVPAGPMVQQTAGRAAPARTYQDLLANPYDEALFDHHFTARLARVALGGGEARDVGDAGIIPSFSHSPDGRYLLVTRVKRPYSYLVTWARFPQETLVLDAATGQTVRRLADLPLAEDVPIISDAVRPGPRSIGWRADAPATLVWAEAQDGGDPRRQAAVHDRLLTLSAPFTGQPATLADLEQRFRRVAWGRGDLALVYTGWDRAKRERVMVMNPSRPGTALRLLLERNTEDQYADPGSPVMSSNAAGRSVLAFTPDGRGIFLQGDGASPRGRYPFLARMDLANGRSQRVWQSADPYYESVVALARPDGSRILTRRESATEPPNYFVRTLPGGAAHAVTAFADPAPQLAGMQRQLITYRRADGVPLSATLYLPAGYDARRDGPLPMLMWAYPREFRDAAAAGQVDDSPNRFSRPSGASQLFLLTQGYAVLDDPAMPIVGANGAEPNDTFIEQLVASAQAAVDKVVEMGVADRDRIAIGGHSYGAFMTAHLLAHTDLFRAGIARSGAYNRTLTPFGFQSEDRTYWEATDTYTKLSPFTYANRIDEPILLTHGELDDNSGTFPIQSERFYAALKGNGATVRYVVLPYETHGYRARESVMHTLAEMVAWMDRYVKNAPPRQPKPAAAPAASR